MKTEEIKWTTDVPDNDGYLTYFGMDNQSLRRKLGLRRGEEVEIIIRRRTDIPKFKIGDKVKYGYLIYTIEAIDDDSYKMTAYGEDGHQGGTSFFSIRCQDKLKLVESV